METLVLDATDAELLLLMDADTREEELALVGGASDGLALEDVEGLLAHTDMPALVLSTDQSVLDSLLDSDVDALLHHPSVPPLIASPTTQAKAGRPSPASGPETSSDSAGSADAGPKAAAPRRRRQKDELEYLRRKAAELTAELSSLKTREELQEPVGHAWSSCTEAATEPTTDVAPQKKTLLWRRVARRQLESRRRAQREHDKLKEMVQGQLEVIHGLEKVLQKRAAMEGTAQWLENRKRVRVVHDSDAATFDKLKMDLDVRYEQTRAVFAGNAYASQKLDGDHVQVKVDGADGMFLEFVASKVVPFGVAETSRVLWTCFTRGRMDLHDGYYSVVDHTDDTLSAKMVLSVRQNNADVLRDAKLVVRRYLQEDRCVLVWACQAETEGTLTKVNGVQMFDLGWTLVEPAPRSQSPGGEGEEDQDEEEGEELPSTIIQSCARVKIKLTSALEHTHEDVVFLTDLVTGSYMRNLLGIHQTVEDLLVKEVLKRAG